MESMNFDERQQCLVLIGAKGMLAQAVAKSAIKHYVLVCLEHSDLDITDYDQVFSTLAEIEPDVIVNCAAYTNVDDCEIEETLAMRVNGTGPGNLARVAQKMDATLVHVSTDYVFSGEKSEPYVEVDITAPRSAYGRSKLAGEQSIIASGLESFFILRTSWLYGPGGNNFVETITRLANDREELRIIADQFGTPTYTEDLASAIFALLTAANRSSVNCRNLYGIYHFSNGGECNWHEFAEEIVTQAEQHGALFKVQNILPIATEEYPLPAVRPAYSVLSKQKYCLATGEQVPDWRDSLKQYFVLRAQITAPLQQV